MTVEQMLDGICDAVDRVWGGQNTLRLVGLYRGLQAVAHIQHLELLQAGDRIEQLQRTCDELERARNKALADRDMVLHFALRGGNSTSITMD